MRNYLLPPNRKGAHRPSGACLKPCGWSLTNRLCRNQQHRIIPDSSIAPRGRVVMGVSQLRRPFLFLKNLSLHPWHRHSHRTANRSPKQARAVPRPPRPWATISARFPPTQETWPVAINPSWTRARPSTFPTSTYGPRSSCRARKIFPRPGTSSANEAFGVEEVDPITFGASTKRVGGGGFWERELRNTCIANRRRECFCA